jgi:hypothetical protein
LYIFEKKCPFLNVVIGSLMCYNISIGGMTMNIEEVKECLRDVCNMNLELECDDIYISSIDNMVKSVYDMYASKWTEYQEVGLPEYKSPKTPPFDRLQSEFLTMLQVTGYYSFITSVDTLTINSAVSQLISDYFLIYRENVIRKVVTDEDNYEVKSGHNELTNPHAELISQIECKNTALFYHRLFYIVTIWVAILCDTKRQFKDVYETTLTKGVKDRKAILKYAEVLLKNEPFLNSDSLTLTSLKGDYNDN